MLAHTAVLTRVLLNKTGGATNLLGADRTRGLLRHVLLREVLGIVVGCYRANRLRIVNLDVACRTNRAIVSRHGVYAVF